MTDEADNPARAAPTLEYGRPDTQYGLTFETSGDGGVVITVPGTGGRYLHQRLTGVHTGTEMLLVTVAFGLRKLFGRPTPPRAVVAVTRDGLSVTEPGGGIGAKDIVRTWPLDQGERGARQPLLQGRLRPHPRPRKLRPPHRPVA
jgi:hypothetical protein